MSAADENKVFVVIPAKDEATRIASVLEAIKKYYSFQIVVVDDGSSDNTARIARRYTPHVIQHKINLGAGAATRTGIDFSLHMDAQYIFLIDADGQHDPQEMAPMLRYLIGENCELVVGSRFVDSDSQIPVSRRVYNWIGNYVTQLVTGTLLTDSQSGFRCMTRKFALENPIMWDGFEFCTEMFRQVAPKKIPIGEFPISVTYTADTLQKGQGLLTGIKMMAKLLMIHIHGR